ncbi:TerC family protein [Alkalihalobacillus sp. CinArs1]|uniref:TerC family protein n=1 Tax=Alkalihalobacillus sp. CinArs1 TaxID=2995314 RepID=UPI0022DE1DA5|nr:TerC family protein [Alkalihalobacillus sp. CinArs1]
MDAGLILEYAWVLLVLIGLEGILAADNALVMAIMVKHLEPNKRKKALFYGLGGAFVFRFGSLFIISFLVDIWQVQAIGALYLLFLSINHLVKKFLLSDDKKKTKKEDKPNNEGSGFWTTVLKVELADIAFAVDSILAAVALALTLPTTNFPKVGGLDGAQFAVILTGGIIGLIIMRFAANYFVKLLHRKPGLETAAFIIVGWVGVKLAIYTLAHPSLAILEESFPKEPAWKITFWGVLVAIALGGWFLSSERDESEREDENEDTLEEESEKAKDFS